MQSEWHFPKPVAKEVRRVAFTEGLTAAVDSAQRDRQAGSGSEDRRDVPAAQQVSYET